MANIRIDLNHKPLDGETVTFKAPCDAKDITGLKIYYTNEAKAVVFEDFTLNDANVGNIGVLDNIFSAGAIVKVILDTDANNAFVQNADTNAYLEGKLAEKYSPDNKPSPEDIGASADGHKHTKSDITDFPTSMTPTAHTHTVSQITGLKTESWTFTLEDGSTVTKAVYVG